MTTSTDTTSQAWAWVLQHSTMIRGIARRQGNGCGIDVEDLHSNAVERIVRKWHDYDPDASSPSTWVWWQVLAAKKGMVHQRRRELAQVELPTDDAYGMPIMQPNAEARVMLHQLHQLAKPDEWQAAAAKAVGLTGSELGAACGCAPFSANRRVSRLLSRITA